MSDEQVEEFRKANNNIVVTNFNEDCLDPILKPTPAFHHAFHNFPDILQTISGIIQKLKCLYLLPVSFRLGTNRLSNDCWRTSTYEYFSEHLNPA
jgi:hypothetical protein